MKKKNKKIFISVIAAVVLIISAVLTFGSKNTWKSFISKTDENTAAIGQLADSEAAAQPLSVHYIDVDQGDSTLIRFGEYNILIDCAKKAYSENVLTYLERLGVDSLDLVIGTHPDADHIGGFTDLFTQIKPKLYVLPQISSKIEKTQTELTLINTLKTMKISTEYAINEKVYTFGEMKLTTYLTQSEHTDKNDYSVVAKVEYKNASYLFMGDAGKAVENEFMKLKDPLQADILKAGHHGSSKSSSKKFVKYVSPEYCIFSCGADNDYGHPHSEVLEIMKKQKVQCYRTDISGSIVIGSNGQNYFIATEK
ncbi:MAG: MBL fold metallo-hydrolase [Clostridia bacterium]|nr:MBL fold metallo-hydrolase [Clostridia bacterium]